MSAALPCLSGTLNDLEDAAVGDDRGLHAVTVAQHEFFHRRAVVGFAERTTFVGQAGSVGSRGGDHQRHSEGREQLSGFKHGMTFLPVVLLLF